MSQSSFIIFTLLSPKVQLLIAIPKININIILTGLFFIVTNGLALGEGGDFHHKC